MADLVARPDHALADGLVNARPRIARETKQTRVASAVRIGHGTKRLGGDEGRGDVAHARSLSHAALQSTRCSGRSPRALCSSSSPRARLRHPRARGSCRALWLCSATRRARRRSHRDCRRRARPRGTRRRCRAPPPRARRAPRTGRRGARAPGVPGRGRPPRRTRRSPTGSPRTPARPPPPPMRSAAPRRAWSARAPAGRARPPPSRRSPSRRARRSASAPACRGRSPPAGSARHRPRGARRSTRAIHAAGVDREAGWVFRDSLGNRLTDCCH